MYKLKIPGKKNSSVLNTKEKTASTKQKKKALHSAGQRSLVSVRGGPVISGVNEVGMLFQSQDIAVRVPVALSCERALHKGLQNIVGELPRAVNYSKDSFTSELFSHNCSTIHTSLSEQFTRGYI